MNEIFKADAFLYIAFITIGLVSLTENLMEKLAVIGAAVVILIVRSVVKRFVYKE